MKIIVALMVVLISLSATTGTSDSDEPDWWQTIRHLHRSTSNKIETSRYVEETVGTFNLISCQQSNRTHAYDAAVEGIQAYVTCIRPVLDNITSIVRKSSSQLIVTNREASGVLANVVCPVLPDAKICFNNFFAASSLCMTTDVIDEVKIVLDVVLPIVEYLCKDHGKWIKDFFAVDGKTCLNSNFQAIVECVHPNFYEDLSETHNYKQLNIPWLNDFIDNCGDLDQLQNCTLTELRNCNSSIPSTMMNSLYNEVKRVVPCGNMFNKNDTSLEPTVTSYRNARRS